MHQEGQKDMRLSGMKMKKDRYQEDLYFGRLEACPRRTAGESLNCSKPASTSSAINALQEKEVDLETGL